MAGEDPLIRADAAEVSVLFLDPDFAAHGQRCGNGAVQVGGRVDKAAQRPQLGVGSAISGESAAVGM